jgi:hypothetical protein
MFPEGPVLALKIHMAWIGIFPLGMEVMVTRFGFQGWIQLHFVQL